MGNKPPKVESKAKLEYMKIEFLTRNKLVLDKKGSSLCQSSSDPRI